MPTLKSRAPRPVKVIGRRLSTYAGERTSSLRLPPAFVLAGGQRCGTTSLYRALMDHPAILSSVHHKGVNYFDVNYSRGWAWYQGHFPMRSVAALRTRGAQDEPITFEASGYYLYHPHAAARIARDLPEVKILAMLRDPVERAYSAYRHEFARGFDKVGSITVLGGEGASSHMASESASSMRATFDAVQAATGIDLRGIIQGQATGRGIAQGLQNEQAQDAAPLRRRTAETAAPAGTAASADAPSPDAV